MNFQAVKNFEKSKSGNFVLYLHFCFKTWSRVNWIMKYKYMFIFIFYYMSDSIELTLISEIIWISLNWMRINLFDWPFFSFLIIYLSDSTIRWLQDGSAEQWFEREEIRESELVRKEKLGF